MLQAIGIFCEDIREERSGQDTIIGVLPDNLAVRTVPSNLPKLGLYIRIHFDPTLDPGDIALWIELPTDHQLHFGTMDRKITEKAIRDALALNQPVAGLISKVLINSFQIPTHGRIRAVANINGRDIILATLNIQATAGTPSS
ncbi:MAG: hypothetical protein ABWZ27_06430 [Aestuariivirgaceae bacterium]